MGKKLFPIILLSLFLILAWPVGWTFGEEQDFKKLSDAEIGKISLTLHEQRVELIRQTRLNGFRTLAEEIDFWGEFLKRMLETANTIVVFEKIDKAYLGLEFSFLQKDKWDVIWGFLPEEEGGLIVTYYGVKRKRIPLIGNLSKIFERLDVALVYCPNVRKMRFAASYRWGE